MAINKVSVLFILTVSLRLKTNSYESKKFALFAKEAECKFETRCGHFFHYKCLRGVFDKCTEMRCHYCKEPVPADRPYIEKYLPAGWSNIEGCPRLVFHGGNAQKKWDKLFPTINVRNAVKEFLLTPKLNG